MVDYNWHCGEINILMSTVHIHKSLVIKKSYNQGMFLTENGKNNKKLWKSDGIMPMCDISILDIDV